MRNNPDNPRVALALGAGVWCVDVTGTHIVLPLNPSLIDEAAVEAMARACEAYNDTRGSISYNGLARAALTALLAHYAEGE